MSPALVQHAEAISGFLYPVVRSLVTPPILRIDRYRLKPGSEVAIRHLHKEMAVALARWGYPHTCLAMESLTGPKEVWRLTGYQSVAEQRQVAQSLESNTRLTGALERIEDQIRVLIGNPESITATCRSGKRSGHTWLMGRGHYIVVAPLEPQEERRGAVYETAGGQRYRITAARTRKNAEGQACSAGWGAVVFSVRPTWGMPAADWVSRDQSFWNPNPVVKRALAAPSVPFGTR
jgi:hypothetical protein